MLVEVVEDPCVSRWLLPSWHFMIDNFGSVQDVEIRRVVAQFLSVDLVGDGDLDRVEVVQNIQLVRFRAE